MSAATGFPCPLMHTASGIVMENSSLALRQLSQSRRQVSDAPDAAHDRMCEFLRERHPQKTAECVQADTKGRVKARTVQKWFERTSAPSFKPFYILIETYGAEFVAAVAENAPETIRDAARIEKDRRYESKLRELKSQFNR